MEKIVIIGGGIAGLSCLNAFLDQGFSPLLLEGAVIGTPKMCGEFLAPQAVSLLNNWGLGPIQEIKETQFFLKNKKFNLYFSEPAGALSRSEAELILARRAQNQGGRIRERSLIKMIHPPLKSAPFILSLASGDVIEAETVVFASGKFGQHSHSRTALPYFGIKLHLPQVVKPSSLLMYSLKGSYFGIVPISAEVSNCACLVKRELIERAGSCKNFFYRLVESNPTLKTVFENCDLSQLDWFESPAPEFQLKQIPSWPRAYWIGDALAGLYPAIGSGFSHALSSALMAVDFYLQNNPMGYLKSAKQVLKPKLFLGMAMHQIMLNPLLASSLFPLLQFNSWFLNRCLKSLGYSSASAKPLATT